MKHMELEKAYKCVIGVGGTETRHIVNEKKKRVKKTLCGRTWDDEMDVHELYGKVWGYEGCAVCKSIASDSWGYQDWDDDRYVW